jgi:hypothetical protein
VRRSVCILKKLRFVFLRIRIVLQDGSKPFFANFLSKKFNSSDQYPLNSQFFEIFVDVDGELSRNLAVKTFDGSICSRILTTSFLKYLLILTASFPDIWRSKHLTASFPSTNFPSYSDIIKMLVLFKISIVIFDFI